MFRLIKSDNFRFDPSGFFFNQSGHAAIGLPAVFLGALAWNWVFGEMPQKEILGGILVFSYLALVELAAQGWRKWDTIEDTAFFSYGVAMTLAVFTEIGIGSGRVVGRPADALGLFFIFALHLLWGVMRRYIDRKMSQD